MPQFPSSTAADGIWSLKQQRRAIRGNIWPSYQYSGPLVVDYLIVAGGGGGGGADDNLGGQGGAGAGGLLFANGQPREKGVLYQIVVGAGGSGEVVNEFFNTVITPSTNGADTSAFGLTAIGGATTIRGNQPSGGSGGGQFRRFSVGLGTAGQGNNGGLANADVNGGGGGGGAGSVGGNASGASGGNGGAGLEWPTGSGNYYAGGGGGGAETNGTPGIGGIGGGGDGGDHPNPGHPGLPNTGGGGGGGGVDDVDRGAFGFGGGNGGSGIVIIRTLSTAVETTGSPTITQDGSFNVYTFTGSGSIRF